MSIQAVVFVILGLVALGSGLGVVTSRNLFRAALLLVLTFFAVAGLYVLLEAEFLAAVQVLIYVGAIAVLILFAIMLAGQSIQNPGRQLNEQWPLAAISGALLLGVLVFILLQVQWPVSDATPPQNAIMQLGVDLMGRYLLPFEVASVLLLVAMVGAILIARER
jgi:NADH-quinone oxidoreductase subunit J